MKNCWRYVAVFLVMLAGVAAWFEPTHCVRGWITGEPFCGGRPLSFWRSEVATWQILVEAEEVSGRIEKVYTPLKTDSSSSLEKWFRTNILRLERRDNWLLLVSSEDGEDVVQALRIDEEPAVQDVAEKIG